jgi:hypothetical protein
MRVKARGVGIFLRRAGMIRLGASTYEGYDAADKQSPNLSAMFAFCNPFRFQLQRHSGFRQDRS